MRNIEHPNMNTHYPYSHNSSGENFPDAFVSKTFLAISICSLLPGSGFQQTLNLFLSVFLAQ